MGRFFGKVVEPNPWLGLVLGSLLVAPSALAANLVVDRQLVVDAVYAAEHTWNSEQGFQQAYNNLNTVRVDIQSLYPSQDKQIIDVSLYEAQLRIRNSFENAGDRIFFLREKATIAVQAIDRLLPQIIPFPPNSGPGPFPPGNGPGPFPPGNGPGPGGPGHGGPDHGGPGHGGPGHGGPGGPINFCKPSGTFLISSGDVPGNKNPAELTCSKSSRPGDFITNDAGNNNCCSGRLRLTNPKSAQQVKVSGCPAGKGVDWDNWDTYCD